MLADEYNSGEPTTGYANLYNTSVYNNIVAGCPIAIFDYAEGTPTTLNHGIKNTLIANNVFIMAVDRTPYTNAGTSVFGIRLADNGTRNVNTMIVNNIVYGFTGDPLVHRDASRSGVTLDYNVYYSAGTATPFEAGFNSLTRFNFADWRAASGSDAHSVYANPKLINVNVFDQPSDYANAKPQASSPAIGIGSVLSGCSINATCAFMKNFAKCKPRNVGYRRIWR